jgi:hypothetical protein
VPLSQADRRDVNEAEPVNGLEPEPQPQTPPGPQSPIPEGNAVTLPAPPRVEPAPKQ